MINAAAAPPRPNQAPGVGLTGTCMHSLEVNNIHSIQRRVQVHMQPKAIPLTDKHNGCTQ